VLLVYLYNVFLLCCYSANTTVAGSPFQISQQDAQAEVDSVSRQLS